MPTIGVQMMMLKSKVEDIGPYEVLRRLETIGFSAVEVSQIPMTPANVAEMRRAKDELGTDFGALSAALDAGPNDSLVEDYVKIVDDARTLGASRLRIGMMPLAAMASHEALLGFCRQAEQVAARLADDGLTLYYHNHHLEFAKRGNSTDPGHHPRRGTHHAAGDRRALGAARWPGPRADPAEVRRSGRPRSPQGLPNRRAAGDRRSRRCRPATTPPSCRPSPMSCSSARSAKATSTGPRSSTRRSPPARSTCSSSRTTSTGATPSTACRRPGTTSWLWATKPLLTYEKENTMSH